MTVHTVSSSASAFASGLPALGARLSQSRSALDNDGVSHSARVNLVLLRWKLVLALT